MNASDLQIKLSENTPSYTSRYVELSKILLRLQITQTNAEKALEILLKLIPDYAISNIKEIYQFSLFSADQMTQQKTDPWKIPILEIRVKRLAGVVFEKTFQASVESGWYYYITGVDLLKPKFIEEIDHYFNKKPKNLAKDLSTDIGHDQTQNCIKVDKIYRKPDPLFDLGDNQLTLNDLEFRTLIDMSTQHSFELRVNNKSILLDAGFNWYIYEEDADYINRNYQYNIKEKILDVKKYLNENPPKWIIITHSHNDHFEGISWLLRFFYDDIEAIIATKTTLLSLYNRISKDLRKKLLAKIYAVRYYDTIKICQDLVFTCYPAGHIPGAISVCFKCNYQMSSSDPLGNTAQKRSQKKKQWSLFYSSDFYIEDMPPIGGLNSAITKIPNKLDIAILDGTNRNFDNTPLTTQISDLYKESYQTWKNNGSVMIATDPYSIAIFIYLFFYEELKGTPNSIPIYADPTILDQLAILTHCVEDLSPKIKSQIVNNKNPFASWRLRPLKSINSFFEALAEPSLILTYPINIDKPPLSEIYPLFAMNNKNMMVFALYIPRDDEKIQNFIKMKHNPINQTITTTLNGILEKPIEKLSISPKCAVFNRKFPHHLFQNHPDKKQLELFLSNFEVRQKIIFHKNPPAVLKNHKIQ